MSDNLPFHDLLFAELEAANEKLEPCPNCGSENVSFHVMGCEYNPEFHSLFAPPRILVQCNVCSWSSLHYGIPPAPDDKAAYKEYFRLSLQAQIDRAFEQWNSK